MTLQLAVALKGDASSLVQSAGEATRAVGAVGAESQAVASDAAAMAGGIDKAAASSRSAAGAASAQAEALDRLSGKTRSGRAEVEAMAAANDRTAASAKAAALAAAGQASAVERLSRATIDQALGVRDSFGGAARAADVEAYGRALDDLRARYNPLFAAGRTYKEQLREIREAERLGAISAGEAAAAIARTKAAFAGQVGVLQAHGNAMKLNGQQAAQLAFQMNDVAVSLASGMNPVLVAIQQGSQITPIFGGIGGTLKALQGVLTPTTLAIGGLTSSILLAATAYASYLTSTKEVETALAGLGRGSGATIGELEAIAEAAAASGEATAKEARRMEAAFLRTGKIHADLFGDMIAVSRDLAATIGTDAATAAEQLAASLADPVRGAQQLKDQYGLLDGATVRYVKTLAAQGRQTEAQSALLAALGPRLADAEKAVTGLERVWRGLSNTLAEVYDNVGAAVDRLMDGPNLAQQIIEARRELKLFTTGWTADPEKALETRRRLQELERRQSAEDAKAEAEARAKALREAGDRAIETAGRSPANADRRRLEELRNELQLLQAGLAAPDATLTERWNISQAIEANRHAIETYIPIAEKQQQLDRLDIQIAEARDPITRAELVARRERLALAGEEITAAEAARRVENARTKAIEESLSVYRIQLADMRADTAARAAVNDAVEGGTLSLAAAERQYRIELALRPLLIAQAEAEGETKEKLTRQINALRAAYAAAAEEEARSRAIDAIQAGRDRIVDLETEIQLIGQSAAVRARTLDLLEAERQIRDMGLASGSAEAEQLRQNAALRAELTLELERQKAAYEALEGFGTRSIDALTDALADNELTWSKLGDVADGVLQDLKKTILQLAFANPLKNALFGENLPTLSDAGGLLGQLFGGGKAKVTAGQQVSAMTVSATTVIVNGATAGLAANLTPGAAANSNDAITNRVNQGFDVFSGASGDVRTILEETARRYGIDPRDFGTVGKIESAFNPRATNGSMKGLFQFSPDTAGQYGLADPFNPAANADAAARLWLDNARGLRGTLGRDPVGWENYVAHQQGLGGARALFADPDRPAVDALNSLSFYSSRPGLAEKAITGNGGQIGMSSAEFLDVWKSKFERVSGTLEDFGAKAASSTDAVGRLGEGVSDASKSILGSATGITKASTSLSTSTMDLADGTQNAFQQLLGGLGAGVDGLISGLGSILSGIGGGGGGFGGLLTGIVNIISGVFGGSSTTVPVPTPRPVMSRTTAVAGQMLAGGTTPAAAAAGGQRTQQILQLKVENRVPNAEYSTREEDDGQGGRRPVVVVSEMVGGVISTHGSKAQRSVSDVFGVAPRTTER
jgi:phage-related minor tail protein